MFYLFESYAVLEWWLPWITAGCRVEYENIFLIYDDIWENVFLLEMIYFFKTLPEIWQSSVPTFFL